MKRNRLLALSVVGVVVGALTLSGAGYSKEGKATLAITPAPAFTGTDLSTIGANWLTPEGDINGDGYSTLSQINKSNVGTLSSAWTKNLLDPNCNATIANNCGTAEDNGLVYKGVYYLQNMHGSVFAMDATTGDTIWTYEAPGTGAGTFRGIAMGNGLIYASQQDGDIVALRMTDGSVYWDTNVGPTSSGYRVDGGLVYLNYRGNNMVFMGESGGDTGVSDYVTALNANTGQLDWRFNIIPTPGSPGYDTWASPINWQDGGGSVWETQMAVDPKLGMIYASTGNPIPWNYTGPGTELYTESEVAMDLSTGKLDWYYQTVHHDIWDNDMMNGPILFNAKFRPYKILAPGSLNPSYLPGGNGQPVGAQVKYTGPAVEQPALSVATKMGYLFILNRQTGKPLIPTPEETYPTIPALDESPTQPYPLGDADWAGQCFTTPTDEAQWGPTAPDGNPYHFGCTFSPYTDSFYVVTPHDTVDWPTMSVNPNTATEYVCGSNDRGGAIESVTAATNIAETGLVKQGEGAHQQTSPSSAAAALPGGGNHYLGEVVAINLTTNNFDWRTYLPPVAINPATDAQASTVKTGPCYSGLTSTASGLIFVGLNDGTIQALDASTGKALWTSPHPAGGTGDGGCNDKPIVYQGPDGNEYVSIYCGGDGHEGVQAGNLIQTFSLPA